MGRVRPVRRACHLSTFNVLRISKSSEKFFSGYEIINCIVNEMHFMKFLNILHCCPFDRQAVRVVATSLVIEPSSFCIKVKSQSLQNILLKWLIFHVMDY